MFYKNKVFDKLFLKSSLKKTKKKLYLDKLLYIYIVLAL